MASLAEALGLQQEVTGEQAELDRVLRELGRDSLMSGRTTEDGTAALLRQSAFYKEGLPLVGAVALGGESTAPAPEPEPSHRLKLKLKERGE